MTGSNAARTNWLIACIVLLGVGFAGGYKWGATRKPVVVADTATASKPIASAAAVYASGPGGCMHVDGSEWICPGMKDLTVAGDRLFLRGDSITIGPISVSYRGSTYILPVTPHADAIFFTPEAAQILLEHYVATNSAKATALRKLLNSLPRP